jgi:hypothetical protein
MKRVFTTTLFLSFIYLPLFAQLSLTDVAPISENFDALGTSTTDALSTNWRIHRSSTPTFTGGTRTLTNQASSGSPTAGSTYNWGSSASERAAGVMSSGTFSSPSSLMGWYSNTMTTKKITSVTVSYDVERYRINSAAASVQFFYSIDGSTWVSVSAGDVATSALPTGTSAYGFNPPNLTVNVTAFLISGLNIDVAGSLYLRWNLNTTGSNSQGIGIDNVVVTVTGVLPVEFQSIKANNTGNTNTIAWQVANEINITSYSVEHSADNNTWATIGTVPATKASAYTFEDKTPFPIAYYRVRAEELDGSKGKVTKVVSVQRNGKSNGLKVYPQPTANTATVELNSTRTGMTNLTLTDLSGRVVLQQNVATVEGLTQIPLNTEGVAKGLYLLRVSNGDWQQTVKFVKQ